jgi:hypothetical protein
VAIVFVFGGVIQEAFKGTCDTIAANDTSGATASC